LSSIEPALLKILLDLRPALDGYSGIPQETRLLFKGLSQLDGVAVSGLIQSNNLVVEAGLPLRRGPGAPEPSHQQKIDRLSQVVVSLQQGAATNRVALMRKRLLKFFGPVGDWFLSLLGRRVALGTFEPAHFQDFVWRSMFAKSLPTADFDSVTMREFRVLRWPWAVLHAAGFLTAKLGRALYLRLDTKGVDVMIVETPYPARVAAPTRMLVRYHDAIPLLMPHTIKDRGYNRAAHFHALHRNVKDGAWFACVSETTRQDLLSVFPEVEARAVTIPNMLPHHFYPETAPADRVVEITWSRKNRDAPHGGGAPISDADMADGSFAYLLMVGTIEPRKNHLALIDAWELLRSQGFPRLNLVVVGALGWEHEAILKRLAPWLQRGGLHLLAGVPASDLRLMYRHAQATVCPSFGEGFDFPGVEAMRCGGVVAASDLPVHHAVFGDACEYFSPYNVEELAQSLHRLIAPDAGPRRDFLIGAGQRVAEQYLPERVMPKWGELLRKVVA
jgi:glycosyltransferase involved in cell wall biosynthesis